MTGDWNLDYRIELTVSTIPEPSTIALFAIGLAGLGFMLRRPRQLAREWRPTK